MDLADDDRRPPPKAKGASAEGGTGAPHGRPIRANQIRDVLMRNWPARNTPRRAPRSTTRRRRGTRSGCGSGRAPPRDRPQETRRSVRPRRDDHPTEGSLFTLPKGPFSPCHFQANRASGEKGGIAPVSPAPLARFGSAGLGRQPEQRRRTMEGGDGTPPRLFLGHPPLSASRVPCTEPATEPATQRGTVRGHHQIATSGVVSRTVGQREKRSIAPSRGRRGGRAVGSCYKNESRSAAVSNPPASRSRGAAPTAAGAPNSPCGLNGRMASVIASLFSSSRPPPPARASDLEHLILPTATATTPTPATVPTTARAGEHPPHERRGAARGRVHLEARRRLRADVPAAVMLRRDLDVAAPPHSRRGHVLNLRVRERAPCRAPSGDRAPPPPPPGRAPGARAPPGSRPGP